ncbi:MAG TPA: hypothetical protein VNI01_00385 [Elusimicrobiota bacterium]|jgi:hypothetical protein|nr:hypothetical protein [Elusimicrobiota bacterium]
MIPAAGLLAALLAVSPARAAEPKPAAAKSSLDPDSLKLVQYVLRTPTGELAPETIPPFMALDPSAVPNDLKAKVLAKREELLALQKIAGGKKKAPLRRIGNDAKAKCSQEDATDAKIKIMRMAGFSLIEEHELMELMNKTNCSECELQEEFTLQVEKLPPKEKGGKPRVAYLLHESDPIFAVIATIRQGGAGTGTNFFGVGGGPKCR